MKKTMYRVSLNESNQTIKQMAILACLSNGREKIGLPDIAGVFRSEKLEFPGLNSQFTLISGDNYLSVDKKDGDKMVNVLLIQEVEVYELNGAADEN